MTGKSLAASVCVALALGMGPGLALADGKKDCTTASKSDWKPRTDAEAAAQAAGHTVRGSKIEGNCYEVYAMTKDGKKVELFYNPVDMKLLKTVQK